MTEQATLDAVRRTVTVEAPQERAFHVFTAEMGTWWPIDTHHIGEVIPEDVVIEPRVGGRCFERAADGTECQWGKVRAWEPPHRVVVGWHLDPDWKFDPDVARATEYEVRFIAEGPSTTRVELEHRGFEALGARAHEVREAIGGEGGWNSLLDRFAAAARAA